jgi:hypothetical protein
MVPSFLLTGLIVVVIPHFCASEDVGLRDTIAYDCTKKQPSVKYSIGTSNDCNLDGVEGSGTTNVTGQLVQVKEDSEFPMEKCVLTKSVQYRYCDWYRRITSINNPLETIHPFHSTVSISECESLATGSPIIRGGKNFQIVEGIQKTFLTSPDIGDDGFCKTWSERVRVFVWTLKLEKTVGYVDHSNLKEGAKLNTIDGNPLGDPTHDHGAVTGRGTYIWEPTRSRYPLLQSLYNGSAEQITYKNGVKMLAIAGINSAFELKHEAIILGRMAITTTDPSIFWVPGSPLSSELWDYPTSGIPTSLWRSSINMNMIRLDGVRRELLLYVHRSTCRIERQVRELAFTRRDLSVSEIGYLVFQAPGFAASVAGEVLTVYKCGRVTIKLDTRRGCYDSIPVVVGKDELPMFLEPRSRSLSTIASKMDCDDPLLPLMHFGGRYVKLSPTLVEVSVQDKIPTLTDLPSLDRNLTTHLLYNDHIIADEIMGETHQERSRRAMAHMMHEMDSGIGMEVVVEPLSDSNFEVTDLHTVGLSLTYGWLLILTVIVVYLFVRGKSILYAAVVESYEGNKH